MDQASDVRETTALVRRVVRRTLTVAGGLAAGTALAWALSTASASADPITGPLTDPLPGQNPAEIVQPVDDTLDAVVARLADPPAPAKPIKDSLHDVGGTIAHAADRFGQRAADHVEALPECPDALCDLDAAGQAPAADGTGFGRMDVQSSAPVVPAPTEAAVTGSGADPERAAERTATGRADAGTSRRGSTVPNAPTRPERPSWPTPLAPVPPSVPAPGHNVQAGSNSADSLLFAALPWLDRTSGLVRGLTVPATDAPATGGRVGAQPGVSPD